MAEGDVRKQLEKLSRSDEIFRATICKIMVVRTLCIERNILTQTSLRQIEQCSVDFRHICKITSIICGRIVSRSVEKAIWIFEHLSEIPTEKDKKNLRNISELANELSGGFRIIGEWMLDLAKEFSSCQSQAISDSQVYTKAVEAAVSTAKSATDSTKATMERAKNKAVEARESANRWGLSLMIPIFNFIAIPVFMARSRESDSAIRMEEKAIQANSTAIVEFDRATANETAAKIACKHVTELVTSLMDIRAVCELMASFWQVQCDEFKDKSQTVEECGGEDPSFYVEQTLAWLRDEKSHFKHLQMTLSIVSNSFVFPTDLVPKDFTKSLILPLHGVKIVNGKELN